MQGFIGSEISKTKECIIRLVDADRDGIGNKARNLARMMKRKPLLFSIPNGLVLLPSFSVKNDMMKVRELLPTLGKGPFAVRSCGLEEDGAFTSMAGKFETQLHVAKDNIVNAIVKVRASFGQDAGTAAVLIQQMIAPDFAGVLFTRSPENYSLASCEYTSGTADAVVSGHVEPERVDYGRWSGNLTLKQEGHRQMLSLLFLVGMIIEDMMGSPQDIEWAYERKSRKLYILQSRNITSFLYNKDIGREQERLAGIALRTKASGTGKVFFEDSVVREVVSSPTPLTRSLLERLYDISGSLGRAFVLLGLPHPKDSGNYVISAFGQLYENCDVRSKLFGLQPKRLWANHNLRRKIKKYPNKQKQWLQQLIETEPELPVIPRKNNTPREMAQWITESFRVFVEDVYPIAYTATLVSQLANEDSHSGALTGQMMRDLSRLHHTGDVDLFVEKWGERSSNDYELSEPRFCEDYGNTIQYAEKFKEFSWEQVEYDDSFTQLKEIAKDRAIRWLYPIRRALLTLEHELALNQGLIFYLRLQDIEKFATGSLSVKEFPDLCINRKKEEEHLGTISLGSKITLEAIEQLRTNDSASTGLRGKMVAHRSSFSGIARRISPQEAGNVQQGDIIIAKYLEPELVGCFQKSAGCLAEKGGALSHAAIVGRELSYPILILPGCSSTIQDGDLIEVSEEGTITVRSSVVKNHVR